MSRKKRILFISLIVLVLVCFLLSVFVFCAVKETKINFSTESTMNENEIVKCLNQKNAIPYGVSTLFVNRANVLNKVEETVPKIKVNNIEIEFPNIIKINCEERIELFCIEVNESVLILDYEMKVISSMVKNDIRKENFVNLVIDDELKIDQDSWELGKKINHKYLSECLSVYEILISYYSSNSYSEIFCNHFNQIYVKQKYDIENNVYFPTLIFETSAGKSIILDNPLIDTHSRLGKLIAITGDSSLTQEKIEITY